MRHFAAGVNRPPHALVCQPQNKIKTRLVGAWKGLVCLNPSIRCRREEQGVLARKRWLMKPLSSTSLGRWFSACSKAHSPEPDSAPRFICFRFALKTSRHSKIRYEACHEAFIFQFCLPSFDAVLLSSGCSSLSGLGTQPSWTTSGSGNTLRVLGSLLELFHFLIQTHSGIILLV